MLARKFVGASTGSLLTLYKAILRSRLEYASPAFVLCPSTALRALDKIQNRALRIILGLPRHTAIAAMEIEAHIPPLQLRYQSLFLNFLARGAAYHRTHFTTLLTDRPTANFRRCGNFHQTIHRIGPPEPLLHLHLHTAPTRTHSILPPWTSITDHLVLVDDWCDGTKDSHLAVSLASDFLRTLAAARLGSHVFYTDGSLDPSTGRAAFAVTCSTTKQSVCHRLPDGFSVLSAELAAIRHALQLALVTGLTQLVVATDSASSIAVIRAQNHPFGQDILTLSLELQRVVVIWCPSHVGVPGNEKADSLAKAALSDTTVLPLAWNLLDLQRKTKQLTESHWALRWQEGTTGRFLFSIKPSPATWVHTQGLTRLQSRVLAGLRCRRVSCNDILYQFLKSDSPLCRHCQKEETITHFLLDCSAFSSARNDFRAALQTRDIPFQVPILLGGGSLPLNNQLHVRNELLTYIQRTKTLRGLLF